jgi:hypothetical protein
MDLLSTNVRSPRLKESSLLIHGSCLEVEAPGIFHELVQRKVPLAVCLEKVHMNTVGFKIATIIKVASPLGIAVLTMDGSPHCVQLHFAVEQAIQQTGCELKPRHFVVNKGALHEISRETVWLARHLADLNVIRESSRATGGQVRKT